MTSMDSSPPSGKAEGDISDTFASLSGRKAPPLPDRFRKLKLRLVNGHEGAVIASWERLLAILRKENELIAQTGPAIIPEVRFSHLHQDLASNKQEIKKRGVAVIRGVIPEDEARAYKFEIAEYARQNPQTRGFPPTAPQVLELYWSAPQIRARSHPSLLQAQAALMTTLWHAPSPHCPISLRTPLAYADRLRIRQPGDAQFALGPHQDGGSVEQWEERGYGRGAVYDAVFRGQWERGYDAFDAGGRMAAVTDLYGGLGACSMFRMFQGWLAMSRSGPGEGTLLVNPLVRESGVYALLRPFFRAVKGVGEVGERGFLEGGNWVFTGGSEMGSELHGAMPGYAQEFPGGMHPHLELGRTMVNVPEVRPGDYVVWHCDNECAIHAVDKTHAGKSDSSVLYIPVCPTTETSARYVVRQREAFRQGTPGPDFPGGEGESRHIGRATEEYARKHSNPVGLQAMGLDKLAIADSETPGAKEALERANAVLGI
ncbi:DUF1479-domain-containing protein [Trichocladium antarcticum]|uniref:DUF1479-domain-containing protein n=1 Tax=Trichocladium antarcticum TaxID=1450529 RepID=A0AAN6UH52_9PEZI|nr:DUF1479-domain-containing protein [Trichocladium antarcticum]